MDDPTESSDYLDRQCVNYLDHVHCQFGACHIPETFRPHKSYKALFMCSSCMQPCWQVPPMAEFKFELRWHQRHRIVRRARFGSCSVRTDQIVLVPQTRSIQPQPVRWLTSCMKAEISSAMLTLQLSDLVSEGMRGGGGYSFPNTTAASSYITINVGSQNLIVLTTH